MRAPEMQRDAFTWLLQQYAPQQQLTPVGQAQAAAAPRPPEAPAGGFASDRDQLRAVQHTQHLKKHAMNALHGLQMGVRFFAPHAGALDNQTRATITITAAAATAAATAAENVRNALWAAGWPMECGAYEIVLPISMSHPETLFGLLRDVLRAAVRHPRGGD